MVKRYNAEIVAGALLPDESRIIAKLMLKGISNDELDRLIKIENVLQKRSPATAVRKTELIRKRLATVDSEMIQIFAESDRRVQVQALLVASIKHSSLIGDFLSRVIRQKWRSFEKRLTATDWDEFLLECEQIDPNVKKWKPSTRTKLGQVVKKCLVEAGYLESAQNPVICPVMLAPEIKRYLLERQDDYVLNSLEITS